MRTVLSVNRAREVSAAILTSVPDPPSPEPYDPADPLTMCA